MKIAKWHTTALIACSAALVGGASALGEDYNGIAQPAQWPPITEPSSRPMSVPYLDKPPAVIPIDVGRQLFVDDFLIEHSTLARTYHRPTYHPDNPVLEPDPHKPWEWEGRAPYALPFSDGVWFDPDDQKFKMWYLATGGKSLDVTCYAVSDDGVHWTKPDLDVEPGTNIVLREQRDSSTVWLDHNETDPARRFKMFLVGSPWRIQYRTSPDGLRWSDPVLYSPELGDRSTVFYNPFRKKWVASIRTEGRRRAYREADTAEALLQWDKRDVFYWCGADQRDPRHPDFPEVKPQLYNLDAAPYESLMIGLFTIWQGPSNSRCRELGIQKRNQVFVGYSRDGFHWYRPDRRPFMGVDDNEGAWNLGNVQSVGGGCLVVGDRLYFYVSGRRKNDRFWDGHASTGLATLRRDGFASLDADAQGGTVTTRPVTFTGKHLFVNAEAGNGSLRVEILDEAGRVIEPYSATRCNPLTDDATLAKITWRGVQDLSPLAGKPVRFRFHVNNGSLYAFWVSPDASGASHGYVAGGGPGFTGALDTVGDKALNRSAP
jgi:hypothetical protein